MVLKSLVIGNSISRKDIEISRLKKFEIYGCNALYRDFTPDHLITTDLKMIKEIIKSGYKNPVYTLPSVNATVGKQFITLPNQTEELCPSGVRAVKLALEKHTEIYMLGMDFTNDNVYKGTPTYGDHWDFNKWIKDIEHVINKHKDLNFIRIGAQKHNIAPHSNFKEITVTEFANKYYTY
jgi:hypothetical protein